MLFCSLSREGTELEALAQGEREGSTGTARSGVRLGVRASSFSRIRMQPQQILCVCVCVCVCVCMCVCVCVGVSPCECLCV
jgi:hypothetical protein